jgi:hypothetical protein
VRHRRVRLAILGAALALSASAARAQDPPPPAPTPEEEPTWEFSTSLYTYFLRFQPYGQPTATADRDWLHLEARYNYEDLETGSLWVGYNFSAGEDLTLELTPMIGVVFGETDGFAPGYRLSLAYGKLELYSEGEYVFDSEDSEADFFYSWNELTFYFTDWMRAGLVAQRTRAYETELDIQRGLILGFSVESASLAFHLFNPDKDDPLAVVSIAVSF